MMLLVLFFKYKSVITGDSLDILSRYLKHVGQMLYGASKTNNEH